MKKAGKTSEKNPHAEHRIRMRKRFARDLEMEAFSEHEILEVLLYSGIPMKDTNVLAHLLIDTFGSFANVFNASVEDLFAVKNMTMNAALLIKLIPPISRAIGTSRSKGRSYLYSTADSIRFLSSYFINDMNEKAYVACLDVNYRVLDVVNIGKGNASSTGIDLAKLLKVVSASGANKAILMHNHPSGSVIPSEADYFTTNYAILMLFPQDIKLIDHLIFSPNGEFFSFHQNHIIERLLEHCNDAMSIDIASSYKNQNRIAYHDKGVSLNEEMQQDCFDTIGNLFDCGDKNLQKLIVDIGKTVK